MKEFKKRVRVIDLEMGEYFQFKSGGSTIEFKGVFDHPDGYLMKFSYKNSKEIQKMFISAILRVFVS